MSNRVLKWGLLSTAAINRAVIAPLRVSPRNQLVAVASRQQSRAEGYAAEWGIPRAFGTYEAMLADPEIDVVYVSLPNSMHAEWTIKAAEAGKHVLVEKPIAMNVDECDEVCLFDRFELQVQFSVEGESMCLVKPPKDGEHPVLPVLGNFIIFIQKTADFRFRKEIQEIIQVPLIHRRKCCVAMVHGHFAMISPVNGLIIQMQACIRQTGIQIRWDIFMEIAEEPQYVSWVLAHHCPPSAALTVPNLKCVMPAKTLLYLISAM
jgi:hypothetical protein